jgi:dTDP-4-dehydrorhamnose reductase
MIERWRYPDPVILVVGGGRLAERMLKLSSLGLPLEIARHHDLNVGDARQVAEYMARAKRHGIEVVINCAAYTDVDKMEAMPQLGTAVNSLAPGFLATACNAYGMKLLHVSTDYVFGGGVEGPYRVGDRPFPVQQYGLSKLRGEWTAAMSKDTVIARIGWLFGPEYWNCAPMLALKSGYEAVKTASGEVIQAVKPVSIWDDMTGTPTHVGAAASVLLRLAWQMYDGVALPPIVHVGPNYAPISWYDFLQGRYPAIRRGTSVATNTRARRPRVGGLVPSPEGITASYGEMMDMFQREIREAQSVPTGS